MKKMHLNLGELRVETFATSDGMRETGTVQGHAITVNGCSLGNCTLGLCTQGSSCSGPVACLCITRNTDCV